MQIFETTFESIINKHFLRFDEILCSGHKEYSSNEQRHYTQDIRNMAVMNKDMHGT